MIKSWLIVFASFAITYFVFKVLFSNIKIEHSSNDLAPYGTVIDYWCSRLGIEYIVTSHGDMILHVDRYGKPVLCAVYEPLARD